MCRQAEDVGGSLGFYDFLEAIADSRLPDREDLLNWHGGPLDPHHPDLERINKDLSQLTTRRQRAAENRRT